MKNVTKSKFDSDIVKFQTKIRKNLQSFCFLKDAVLHFSKFNKSKFDDYQFNNFISHFKRISFKDSSEIKNIKYSKLLDYGEKLIKNELSNSIFVLNMSDFENWLAESFNLIFIDDRKLLLRYLEIDKTPLKLSLVEQSNSIEEVWQKIINSYLLKKIYGGMSTILKHFLSTCNIKEDKEFEKIIGEINENYLCRNLIIHNKNKINKEYLDKCGNHCRFSKSGQLVEISEEYLFKQGDILLFFMQNIRKTLKL